MGPLLPLILVTLLTCCDQSSSASLRRETVVSRDPRHHPPPMKDGQFLFDVRILDKKEMQVKNVICVEKSIANHMANYAQEYISDQSIEWGKVHKVVYKPDRSTEISVTIKDGKAKILVRKSKVKIPGAGESAAAPTPNEKATAMVTHGAAADRGGLRRQLQDFLSAEENEFDRMLGQRKKVDVQKKRRERKRKWRYEFKIDARCRLCNPDEEEPPNGRKLHRRNTFEPWMSKHLEEAIKKDCAVVAKGKVNTYFKQIP